MGEPRLNAEILLAEVLELKRLDLYLQHDRPLREEELAAFRQAVRRRARHEPLQYIAGRADFRSLRLLVDRRVLIPRPETEVLVGEVLRWAADSGASTALDLGTGSGAIALSLAVEGVFDRIVGCDVSTDALEVARENLRRLSPATPVELRPGDLFDAVVGECFDLVVSNPPYVGECERADLHGEVLDWEPREALFSGDEGLDIIRRVVESAPRHLSEGGLLALEIGASQSEAVIEMIRRAGRFAEPQIRRDLAGRERILFAERA